MSTASKEAVMLRNLLNDRRNMAQPLAGLATDLLTEASPLLDSVWALSGAPDLAYPCVRGDRPKDLEEMLSYLERTYSAAFDDAEIHKVFYEVLGLVKPISALYADNVAQKVRPAGTMTACLD
jgi:hypothetical protein